MKLDLIRDSTTRQCSDLVPPRNTSMDPTLPNQTLHCTLVTRMRTNSLYKLRVNRLLNHLILPLKSKITKLSLNHQDKLNMRLQISPERLMPNDQNVVQDQPLKHQLAHIPLKTKALQFCSGSDKQSKVPVTKAFGFCFTSSPIPNETRVESEASITIQRTFKLKKKHIYQI
ncbi:hypothetical protein YC2023_039477 [Brassica napus]